MSRVDLAVLCTIALVSMAASTRVKDLEGQVELMEQTADRYAQWRTCISWCP
jgi:hypothetical protein